MKKALAIIVAFTIIFSIMATPTSAYVRGEIPRKIADAISNKMYNQLEPVISFVSIIIECIIDVFTAPFEEQPA